MSEFLVTDWVADFLPVEVDSLIREPKWHVARYDWALRTTLLRVFRFVSAEFHEFSYLQAVKGQPPVTRYWLPGYVFIKYDERTDRWQQFNRMPGFIEMLGALGAGEFEDFDSHLAKKVSRRDITARFNPGDDVRIMVGVFAGHVGKVQRYGHKKDLVDVAAIVFNRPMNLEMHESAVEKIG